ncbi:MAG: general secretion pathway protein GspB, partial [Pseudomonadales bacterium]
LLTPDAPGGAPASAAPVEAPVAPPAPAPADAPAAGSAAPALPSVATAVQEAAPAAPPPQVTTPPAPPVRLALRELPADVRGRFPGLAFSTHVYSEHADLRAVVANGQRLIEGDRIQGVRIDEITETGVVLAFERYLVEVPVFTDWEAL